MDYDRVREILEGVWETAQRTDNTVQRTLTINRKVQEIVNLLDKSDVVMIDGNFVNLHDPERGRR